MEENQNQAHPNTRKYFTVEEKFKIIKEYLTTKTAMTEICKKYGINASQFYRWQELFFAGAKVGLESKRTPSVQAGSVDLEAQERELKRLRDVVMELAAENVTLKKTPGVFNLRR